MKIDYTEIPSCAGHTEWSRTLHDMYYGLLIGLERMAKNGGNGKGALHERQTVYARRILPNYLLGG
jgi:hypothetical protein